MVNYVNFQQNYLLAILPNKTYQILLPHLKFVHLFQGQILNLPNKIIQKVYFPLDCVLSITLTMNKGITVDVGIIGNREVLGINAFMGEKTITQTEYIVQISGTAIELPAAIARQIFQEDLEFRNVILQYTQAFLAQIAQNTACNRVHLLEQRLARCLLEVKARLSSNKLPFTQEFLSNILGVRRPGVTLALQKLHEKDCISSSRGEISIINAKKLESCSCDCFRTVQEEYDRLLGNLTPR